MNIAHLRYFKNLAECGNFTQAARLSYVTQPALSSAIRSLERELGFLLIENEGSGFRLTNAGCLFYEVVHRSLEDIDRVVAVCRADETVPRIIRAGADSLGFLRTVFATVDDIAKHDLPDTTLSMQKFERTELLDSLHQSAIDIAFTMDACNRDGLTCSKVMSCSLAACVSPSSELASAASLSSASLASRKVLTYHRKTTIGRQIATWIQQCGLHAIFDFEDEATLLSMVRADHNSVALMVVPRHAPSLLNNVRLLPLRESEGKFFLYAIQREKEPPDTAGSLLKSKLVLRNLGLGV